MVSDAKLTVRQGSSVHLMDETESNGKYTKSHTTGLGRCCVRYGRTCIVCSLSSRYGYFPATCHVGPHSGCMLITYCLAIGPAFFFLVDNLLLWIKVALLVSICLTTVSFTMVACSDPGVVFQDFEIGDSIETGIVCAQCEVLRPMNASHCSDCGVCIKELDHHCPWTGKCVGQRTIKWFYVFLTFISLHCMLIGGVCFAIFCC